MSNVQKIQLRIEAEIINEWFERLYSDDEVLEAMELLASMLPAVQMQLAAAIVKGDAKFKGNSIDGFEIVETEEQEDV